MGGLTMTCRNFLVLVLSCLIASFASPFGALAEDSFTYCQEGTCSIIDGEQRQDFFHKQLPNVKGGWYVRYHQVAYHCKARDQYALTFDDGPSKNLPQILRILERHGVIATFFVVGHGLKTPEQEGMLHEIHQHGHQIANHTMNHPSLIHLTPEEALAQLDQARQRIDDILQDTDRNPADTFLYRPPYGEIDERVGSFLRQHGYHGVIWNSDRYDWKDLTRDDIIARVNQHLHLVHQPSVQNNSILDLNHDGSLATTQALDTILKNIKLAGYEFVSVSQCLGLSP